MEAEPAATPMAAPRCGAVLAVASGGSVASGASVASVASVASGARRPGTTQRYEPDGPANRAKVAVLYWTNDWSGFSPAESGGRAGARADRLAGRRHPGRHHGRAAEGR